MKLIEFISNLFQDADELFKMRTFCYSPQIVNGGDQNRFEEDTSACCDYITLLHLGRELHTFFRMQIELKIGTYFKRSTKA